MAHINLLPWRAEERERKNREFISWLALAFIAAAAIAFFVWYLFNAALDDQRQANDLIEAENAKLDTKLEQIADLEVRREAIISRMKVVQDLQGRRPVPVRIWHDVAQAVPQEMYLNSFSREGNTLRFSGRAANPNVVSNLVTNLDNSLWMQGATVRNISKQDVAAYGQTVQSATSLPEDSYVTFEVTTSIVLELPEEEQQGDIIENSTEDSSQIDDTQANYDDQYRDSGTDGLETSDNTNVPIDIDENSVQDNSSIDDINADSTVIDSNNPNDMSGDSNVPIESNVSTSNDGVSDDSSIEAEINSDSTDLVDTNDSQVIEDNSIQDSSIQDNSNVNSQMAGGTT